MRSPGHLQRMRKPRLARRCLLWDICRRLAVKRRARFSADGSFRRATRLSNSSKACASDRPARRSSGLSPSPKFQHSSGAGVSPVLPSARACRADSDPVCTHDGATHAVANRSAIELTSGEGSSQARDRAGQAAHLHDPAWVLRPQNSWSAQNRVGKPISSP
jgi:hypothetical protein